MKSKKQKKIVSPIEAKMTKICNALQNASDSEHKINITFLQTEPKNEYSIKHEHN